MQRTKAPMAYRLLGVLLLSSGLFAVAAAPPASPEAQEDARQVAKRVDAKYNALKSLQAAFVETYQGPGASRKESGSLSLKRAGKMRWEFTQPTEKLFVSDGKNAFFYIPSERQVRKAPVKKLDDFRSPIRYLLGKAKLEKEFDDLKLESAMRISRPGNVIISGVPKHMAERVQRVFLEISPSSQIERIVIQEIDDSTTEFQFSNLVENPPLSDQHFKFKIPPGVETIDATDLTGD